MTQETAPETVTIDTALVEAHKAVRSQLLAAISYTKSESTVWATQIEVAKLSADHKEFYKHSDAIYQEELSKVVSEGRLEEGKPASSCPGAVTLRSYKSVITAGMKADVDLTLSMVEFRKAVKASKDAAKADTAKADTTPADAATPATNQATQEQATVIHTPESDSKDLLAILERQGIAFAQDIVQAFIEQHADEQAEQALATA